MPMQEEKWFLLVIHLDKTNTMQDILKVFTANGVTGCTIFESTGVGHTTFLKNDEPIIASMKRMFGPDRQYNKTVLSVIETEALLEKTMNDIEDIVGDFCKPDTGLMYAIPVRHVRGYKVDLGDDKSTCKI